LFEEIEKIKEKYIHLQNNNCVDYMTESDTREKFVVPFLKALGFTEDCIYRETQIVRGKAIVDIEIRKNGKTILLIEVKRAAVNKLDSHLYQLTSYLSSREEIEWGRWYKRKDKSTSRVKSIKHTSKHGCCGSR